MANISGKWSLEREENMKAIAMEVGRSTKDPMGTMPKLVLDVNLTETSVKFTRSVDGKVLEESKMDLGKETIKNDHETLVEVKMTPRLRENGSKLLIQMNVMEGSSIFCLPKKGTITLEVQNNQLVSTHKVGHITGKRWFKRL